MPMTTHLPPALQTRLDLIGPLLETQGVVQCHHGRGRQTYRLRYRQFDPDLGYSVHRSLSLGRDPLIAQQVATHIALLRQKPMEDRLIASTEAACQRAAERANRAAVRRMQRDRHAAGRALPRDPEKAVAQLLNRMSEIAQAAQQRVSAGHTGETSAMAGHR